jgi:hypothetical protein
MLEFCPERDCPRAAVLSAPSNCASAASPSKSLEMILLCEDNQELLWNDNVYKNELVRLGRSGPLGGATVSESVRYVQYRPNRRCVSNSLRMITFANQRMQLLCNDNAYKKPGGRGSGSGSLFEAALSRIGAFRIPLRCRTTPAECALAQIAVATPVECALTECWT